MAEVSVIIPTYNRWPMVSEAIDSVIQQDVDFELIVVDDGSTDETATHLSTWLEKAPAAERLHIVRTVNRGPAAARNCGARLAQAPLIAFLDSDDLWLPGKLRRQLNRMKENPECLVSQTEEIWMRDGVRVNPGRRHRKRQGDFFLDSLRTCLVSPSAVMIRANLFHELAGFDEDLRAAEDYDLWLRLLLKHPVDLLPEPLVVRRAGHPDQLSACVPALDRFRILALLKLLLRSELDGQRRLAVCDALIEKCRIYTAGARRRGRELEASRFEKLAQMADKAWRTGADITLEQAICTMRHCLIRPEDTLAVSPDIATQDAKSHQISKPAARIPTPIDDGDGTAACAENVQHEETISRLRRWAASKHLSELHIQRWLAIDEPGRTRLLEIAESLKMRAGQCVAALELLDEISVRERLSVAEILELPLLTKIFRSKGSGPGRAGALLDQLRALRYPRLRRASELITTELNRMKLPPSIKVILPRDLGSDQVRIEIIAHGSVEMAEALRCLTAKSSDLVRLAAMIDGSDGSPLGSDRSFQNEF